MNKAIRTTPTDQSIFQSTRRARSDPSRCRSPLNRRRPRHPKNHSRGSDTRSNEMFLCGNPVLRCAFQSRGCDAVSTTRILQNIRGLADSGVAGRWICRHTIFPVERSTPKIDCAAKARHTHRGASTPRPHEIDQCTNMDSSFPRCC
jgi:hypothetical protein